MFKPMLAGKCTDVSKLPYPVLVSVKLDGVRATVQYGKLMSRTLKPIPNVNVQARFKGLPEGWDGELIAGDPTAPDAYRKTMSIVMSDDKPADDVRYHVFDKIDSEGFEVRLRGVSNAMDILHLHNLYIRLVSHVLINNAEQLEQLESAWLEQGHEGAMIRSINGPYKEGRSTEKQGYLLKLKRFDDGEAEVIGFVEEEENTNEATTNALGRTERSTKQAGKVGKGTLGAFYVKGITKYHGVEFSVGGGFKAVERAIYWVHRTAFLGKLLKYRYFPTGSKDKPRFPVFIGWRDERDM